MSFQEAPSLNPAVTIHSGIKAIGVSQMQNSGPQILVGFSPLKTYRWDLGVGSLTWGGLRFEGGSPFQFQQIPLINLILIGHVFAY